jgi:O-antigen/teichoic acid export membrane protein
MTVADVVNAPLVTGVGNFPATIILTSTTVMAAVLLFIAGRFDPTRGPLTISLLIVLGMLGAIAYCLIFTIPNDDITPGVVGGLTAGFGAVVAYWLGRPGDPPPTPPQHPSDGDDRP